MSAGPGSGPEAQRDSLEAYAMWRPEQTAAHTSAVIGRLLCEKAVLSQHFLVILSPEGSLVTVAPAIAWTSGWFLINEQCHLLVEAGTFYFLRNATILAMNNPKNNAEHFDFRERRGNIAV